MSLEKAFIQLLQFINSQVESEEELGVWIEDNEDDVSDLEQFMNKAYPDDDDDD